MPSNFKEVATKESGEFFGELALIDNKPRSATIQCLTPCFFAVLDKNSYESSLGKIQKAQMEAMIRFLQGIPQFGGADGGKEENLDPDIKKKKTCTWTKTALSRLSYYFKKVHYRRSNIVYKERDPCKFVYLVYEGEFEISKTVFFKEKDEDQFDHS
jgi:CRP-like cAMP-binding protein